MLAQVGANSAAVSRLAGHTHRFRFRVLAAVTVMGVALGGCSSIALPRIGADPADPSVKVAAVRYRSTIGPYTSLRPTAPSPWRQQNESVAPTPKSGQ